MSSSSTRIIGGLALACSLVLALALAVAPASSGQSGARQSVEFRFEEQRPGVPSGITLAIDYVNPADPDAKPPAVRTVIETLAPGARIDTSVPGQCTASDAQLMAQGADACARASKVGTGTIVIDTGFSGPGRFVSVDVEFLNNSGELIFLSTERGTGARVVSRSPIEGRRIINEAPTLPGTPPDGASLDVVDAQLDRISREIDGVPRGYITTPDACPASGSWTNAVRLTYSDGVTQNADDTSRCSRPGGGGGGGTGAGPRCSVRIVGSGQGETLRGSKLSELLLGRGGSDRINGFGGDDCIRGAGGRDRIRGGGGRDRIKGGAGDDRIRGGGGRDSIRGGAGDDVIDVRDGERDVVRCGSGRDTVRADALDRIADDCERVSRHP